MLNMTQKLQFADGLCIKNANIYRKRFANDLIEPKHRADVKTGGGFWGVAMQMH